MAFRTLARYSEVATSLHISGYPASIRLCPWAIHVQIGSRWRCLTIRRAKILAARVLHQNKPNDTNQSKGTNQ